MTTLISSEAQKTNGQGELQRKCSVAFIKGKQDVMIEDITNNTEYLRFVT